MAFDLCHSYAGEEDVYAAVGSECYGIRGSFESYNLRALPLTDSVASARGAYRALLDMGVKNVQFTVYVSDLSSKKEASPSDAETGEPPIEDRTNENAMTKDKYDDLPPDTEAPAAEAPETTAAPEDGSSSAPWGAGN